MRFELSQSFMFESAHTLDRNVPRVEREPSARVHGHTYTAEVTIVGGRGRDGMVVDLHHLRDAISDVRARLDHRLLDEVPGLDAPTLECLCEFIARKMPGAMDVANVTVSRATGDRCRLVLA